MTPNEHLVRSFDSDTAVGPDGAVVITDGWNAPTGPNGGYVAAIVLRAMMQAVGDPDRAPRSMTCHYLRPPQPGRAVVETTIEREGRSLTTVTARLMQDGRPATIAVGAFSRAFESPLTWELEGPAGVPRPEDVAPLPRHERLPQIAQRLETRWAVGPLPFTASNESRVGGWLRLAEEDRVVDAPLAALLTDAWLPASFSRLAAPAGAPTIDLTIHFRAPLPLDGMAATDYVLGVFQSRHAQHGFVEEDGELWSPDGRLIAMSRQLAILR